MSGGSWTSSAGVTSGACAAPSSVGPAGSAESAGSTGDWVMATPPEGADRGTSAGGDRASAVDAPRRTRRGASSAGVRAATAWAVSSRDRWGVWIGLGPLDAESAPGDPDRERIPDGGGLGAAHDGPVRTLDHGVAALQGGQRTEGAHLA